MHTENQQQQQQNITRRYHCIQQHTIVAFIQAKARLHGLMPKY